MSKYTLIIVTLATLTLLGAPKSASAALQVNNEADFKLFMEKIGDGTITADKCIDPNPSYDKYCYVEIAKSFELTQPIAIPARVHLVGIPVDGQKPVITAFFDVAKYKPDAPACIVSFDGDQVVFENIKLVAKNYFKTPPPPQVNTICMKSNFNFINNVEITTPLDINMFTLVMAQASGIFITGDNNIVRSSQIVLKFGDGILLQGKNASIAASKITTDAYGVIFQTKDLAQAALHSNTVTGKVAFLFSPSAQIPVGLAANIRLLNTFTDTDPVDAATNPEAYAVVYANFPALPQCGTCKDISGNEKVLYADDGTCNTVPASGACMEFKAAFTPMQLTIAKPAAESELQINQNAQPTGSAALPATTPTLLPESELEAKNNAVGGSGGCSLIR